LVGVSLESSLEPFVTWTVSKEPGNRGKRRQDIFERFNLIEIRNGSGLTIQQQTWGVENVDELVRQSIVESVSQSLPTDFSAMPAENRFRRDDRSDLLQCRAPELLADGRQRDSLLVSQPKPPFQLAAQDAILCDEILDSHPQLLIELSRYACEKLVPSHLALWNERADHNVADRRADDHANPATACGALGQIWGKTVSGNSPKPVHGQSTVSLQVQILTRDNGVFSEVTPVVS